MIMPEELYAPQQALLTRIETQLAEGEPVVVQAGLASGKTVIAKCLIERARTSNVVVIANTHEQARGNYRELLPVTRAVGAHSNTITRLVEIGGRLNSDTLVILEDVFWWDNKRNGITSEALYEEVCHITKKVVALGSKGIRWRNRERIWRYSTWDLNPDYKPTREELYAIDGNRVAVDRDFGAED